MKPCDAKHLQPPTSHSLRRIFHVSFGDNMVSYTQLHLSGFVLMITQFLTTHALRLLSREVVTLRNDPPEGVRIVVNEDDLSALEGWVQGPGES